MVLRADPSRLLVSEIATAGARDAAALVKNLLRAGRDCACSRWGAGVGDMAGFLEALLTSLPPVQLSAGLAEAVKHGAIADAEYFAFLETDGAAILAKDGAALERVVQRSVEIKASLVAEDEREAGRRAILNVGHTIGHAIEATSKFEVLHGEAVAIGMVLEARLGEAMGVTKKGTAARIVQLLEQFRLPVERPDGATVDQLIEVMRGDKKVRGGEIRLAMPKEIGAMNGDKKGGWTVAVEEANLHTSITNPP